MPRQKDKNNYVKDGVAYIELSQGFYAQIDCRDLPLVLEHT